jgi:hypothetical protein
MASAPAGCSVGPKLWKHVDQITACGHIGRRQPCRCRGFWTELGFVLECNIEVRAVLVYQVLGSAQGLIWGEVSVCVLKSTAGVHSHNCVFLCCPVIVCRRTRRSERKRQNIEDIHPLLAVGRNTGVPVILFSEMRLLRAGRSQTGALASPSL